MKQLFTKVNAKKRLFTCILLLGLLTTSSIIAQQGTTVSGLVSEAGAPLPGVNIVEKGTTNGTQTDFDGKFNLTLSTDNANLVISYIGFETKNVPVNGETQFNITLNEDTQSLDEVVVVGYGSVKKSDLTGAIASVSAESLTERNFTNPLESVQGNVAGVQISNNTGRLGDGFSIQIRGQSSFAGGNPLFVVDGAPVDDIDFLNPQDIQQIDILKDASSAAIYGSRGSNGVVLITTKSGSSAKGGFNVSFDSFMGIKNVARLPELMDGPTWQYYHKSAYLATINEPGGPLAITPERLESTVIGGSNSVLRERFDANQTFDWYDAVLRSGIQQNNYLNINGRSENGLSYNLGMGYQYETGNLLNEDLDKFTLKTGVSHNVNDKFSFGANVTITKTENERGSSNAMQEAFRLAPFLSPYAIDDNGVETDELFDQPGKLVFPTSGNFAINKTSTYNPLLQIANSSDNVERWNIVGNVFMDYKFTDWLSFRTTFSSGYDNRERGRSWGNLTNEGLSNGGPLGDLDIRKSFNYTWDNQFNINKTFNEKHNVKLLALQSVFSSQIESRFLSSRNLSFESGTDNLGSGPQATFNLGTGFLDESLSSYALRFNYDYDGKYFLTLSNRWDGYSLFSEENKWDSFSAIAAAWTISNENFMENSVFSNLKLRASYGSTGNNSFDRNRNPYPTLNTLNEQLYYDLDGPVNGFRATALANSALTWERTNEVNFGLDFGLANNRVSGSFDYYNRLSEGVLFERLLPVEIGAESGILDNASSVRNKGVEVLLNTKIIKTDKFSWDVTLTYTNNTNSIESINGQTELDDIGNGLFIGESIGVAGENGNRSNYNYVFDGIVQAGETNVPGGVTEGQAKVKDINGDGEITPEDDRVVLGSVDPDWGGSIFTNIRYGNLTLSASAITSQGVYTYSPWRANFTDTRDRGRQKADISFYVPENGAGIPAQFSNEYPQGRNQGDFWRSQQVGYYADASFVKIKNISLSYNFESKILDKLNLKGLRVYANVLDPFVFTDYMGYDPETASASLGVGRTAAITYQLGLSIKL